MAKNPQVTALTKEQMVEFMKLVTEQLEKAYRDGYNEGVSVTLKHVGPLLSVKQIDAANESLLRDIVEKSQASTA